jgi:hypothetical protein
MDDYLYEQLKDKSEDVIKFRLLKSFEEIDREHEKLEGVKMKHFHN